MNISPQSRAWEALAVILLAGLLVLLAVLQYRWLDQLSEREAESRESARRVAQVNTRDLVDRRLAAVADALRSAAEGVPLSLGAEADSRFRVQSLEQFTRALFWVGADPRTAAITSRRIDPTTGGVESAAWAELTDAAPVWTRTLVTLGPEALSSISGRAPLLHRPMVAASDGRQYRGYLLAVLDPPALLEGLGELATGTGAVALRLTPAGDDGPAGERIPVAAGSRFADQPVSAYWVLEPARTLASMEDPVAAQRSRNLILSGGVLLLLAASGALLWVGARRSRRIAAQRLEMVAGVSHELRTPLAVIHSAAANLADGVVHAREHVAEYGELIRSESTRLRRLVDDALRLAGVAQQPRAGTGSIADLAELLETAAREAGVSGDLSGTRDSATVEMEPMDLELVLTNLLRNAVRYGGGPEGVQVDTRLRESRLRLSVSNPAPGVPDGDHEDWFEPFHRGDDARRSHPEGSGMGLSIVRSIVERYGGRVACAAADGRVTVQLDLPARQSARQRESAR